MNLTIQPQVKKMLSPLEVDSCATYTRPPSGALIAAHVSHVQEIAHDEAHERKILTSPDVLEGFVEVLDVVERWKQSL